MGVQLLLTKIRLMVTVIALVSSASLGCSFQSRNPSSNKILQVSMDEVLHKDNITQNVTLDVGNTLTVKLGSNYSTPYRWEADARIGDSSIVRQSGHRYVQPTTERMGAPGTEVWTFDALRRGTTTVTTYYSSFVGKDSKPACTYAAIVTVQ
ncbi:protease inhibitor I42 family protein [Mycobacterium sp. THU-M104]|uniref:protease inhibitor I42 family protein n=1 Tax=Mycobacterium sp. THU-M104 TaxID=3410515 RepID=UPI003B9BCD7C